MREKDTYNKNVAEIHLFIVDRSKNEQDQPKQEFPFCEEFARSESFGYGGYIRYEQRKNILILHSWIASGHRVLETYARNVALAVDKENLEGVIVMESPQRRPCAKLLRKYNASWMVDLHSDDPSEYDFLRGLHGYMLEKPYPLAAISYGGDVWDPEARMCMPIRNRVGVFLNEFQKEKYGTESAVYLSCAYPPRRLHERNLTIGLLFFRPLDQSVEFVESLAQYLYSRPF
jgi:hypothetical protein